MKKTTNKKPQNILFFISSFIILLGLNIYNYFSLDSSLFIRLNYLLNASLQTLLEVFGLYLITYMINHFLGKSIKYLFVGCCFFLLFAHFINFFLIHVLDSTITYPIKMFLFPGFEHFSTNLRAMNLNLKMITITFLSLLSIPMIGCFFYFLTHRVSKKFNFSLSKKQYVFSFLIIISLLFTSEKLFKKTNGNYLKKLPFGSMVFSSQKKHIYTLNKPIKRAREEKAQMDKINSLQIKAKKSSNVFIFIIESLRKDFITKQIAPNLHSFKNENINLKKSSSNANASHLSWFSIFHSIYPYYWTDYNKNQDGSVCLNMLKKLGYSINVISSAELCFFNLDQSIFGKNLKLANNFTDFSLRRDLSTAQRDLLTFDSLNKQIKTHGDKNVFIIFLDSTHSEYSWPNDFPIKFTPVDKNINYLKLFSNKNDLDPLKNRYKNSINFLDSKFKAFFQTLKDENKYDDSVIVITGDHGEEFYDQDSLFHGTHLNYFQTQVPLFLKLPNQENIKNELSSHIDIFPTVLHHLCEENVCRDITDGNSILNNQSQSFTIKVHQSCSDMPKQFIIENENGNIKAEFVQAKNIDKINILSICDKNGTEIDLTSLSLQSYVDKNFGKSFEKLTNE
jgi:hypothetical protein